MEQFLVKKVWVDDARVWAETENGWRANTLLSHWHNLASATPEQRNHFFLSRYGIHWPELDEDLSFEGIFAEAGFCSCSDDEDCVFYEA